MITGPGQMQKVMVLEMLFSFIGYLKATWLYYLFLLLTPTEHFVTLYFRDFIPSTNLAKLCCHIHMVIFWVMLKWSITNQGEALRYVQVWYFSKKKTGLYFRVSVRILLWLRFTFFNKHRAIWFTQSSLKNISSKFQIFWTRSV